MAVDYIEFSRQIKEKYPEYKDIDDEKLAKAMLEKYPEYTEQVTFSNPTQNQPQQETKTGNGFKLPKIDLTPSGLLRNAEYSAVAGALAPVKAIRDKQNPIDAYNNIRDFEYKARDDFRADHPFYRNVDNGLSFITDLAGYLMLPELKAAEGAGALAKGGTFVGNAAINGGVPMALESLKRGENPLQGGLTGTGIAAGISGALHLPAVANKAVGALGNKLTKAVTGLKPETLERIVQPDSIALDLSKNQADQLAYDTTQRLRDAYSKLKGLKGQQVADEADRLSQLNDSALDTPINKIVDDISSAFDKYNYGRINPVRNLEGKVENELYKMLDGIKPNATDTVSPYELLGIKRQVGDMTNWEIPEARNANTILEQIYGKLNNRLNTISPSLQQANKEYAKLYDMLGNKSRLKTILNPKSDIETAISKLKNYKGINSNIYELENQLINELGENPFLSKIDDVNAALDLDKALETGRNWGGIQTLAKELYKPAFKMQRAINKSGIPQKVKNATKALDPIRRALYPITSMGLAPTLYGRVEKSNND